MVYDFGVGGGCRQEGVCVRADVPCSGSRAVPRWTGCPGDASDRSLHAQLCSCLSLAGSWGSTGYHVSADVGVDGQPEAEVRAHTQEPY